MHTELQAFLDEHAAPKHVCKDDVHAGLRPISQLAAAVRKQLVEYEALLDDAANAPHDPMYDGKMENIRQTLAAMQTSIAGLTAHAREARQQFSQLEHNMARWRYDIAGIEAHATGDEAVIRSHAADAPKD